MAVIVPGNGSVRSLVFKLAVRRNEYGGHHRQAAKRRGYHIAHNVAVIVFARPYKAALRAYHAGDGIVDKRVKILYPKLLKALFIFLVYPCKYFLERSVIYL